VKDDSVYLKHVLRCIARIEEYTAAGRESFFSSPLIQDGVIRNLQTLAESSQRLSESIKESYPDVDWKGWLGFGTSWYMTIWALTSYSYIGPSNRMSCG
jgi:uncharacterized protein with HEPN domain